MSGMHHLGKWAVIIAILAYAAGQEPPSLNENTNHVDHDCHWNEHTNNTEYHSRFYASELNAGTSEYAGGNIPPGTPSWNDRVAAEIDRLQDLISDEQVCWSLLNQTDEYRNARLQRLSYIQANHIEKTNTLGMQTTTAALSWVPSPTWRPDVACCHGDDCACAWSNTVDFTIGPMIGSNPSDYPMEGEIRVAFPTQPAYTGGIFYSDGCYPLGIPERRVQRDARFYFRRLRWRNAPDQQARIVGEGYYQTYSQDSNVPGDQFDADGPATQFPVTTEVEQAQTGGGSVAMGTIAFPFTLTDSWIHKNTVTLNWTNYIPNQMARAKTTAAYVGVLFTPTNLRLGDFGVNNVFTTP